MSSILDRIVDQKKEDLILRKKEFKDSDYSSFPGW